MNPYALESIVANFAVVLATDGQGVTFMEDGSEMECRRVRSLKDPVAYRLIAGENHVGPEHSIVLSNNLEDVRAAHKAGSNVLWLRGNDDLLSAAFHYTGANAPLGPVKPALVHMQEIASTWVFPVEPRPARTPSSGDVPKFN